MQVIPMGVLPKLLLDLPHWVGWRYEERGGKATKVPYCVPTGQRASTTDPRTWSIYESAAAAAPRYDGIGFVFSKDDDLVGIDMDDCRNPETGRLEDWAAAIVTQIDSYTEITPSGRGLHILCRGKLPPAGRRKGKIEIYEEGRYFTITANRLPGPAAGIEERTEQLRTLHGRLFPPPPPRPAKANGDASFPPDRWAVIDRVRRQPKGATLWRGDIAGYESQSEAELALCGLIAFYAGDDPAMIDAVFRQSELFRTKWDSERPEGTYGSITIGKALSGKGPGDYYEWKTAAVPKAVPAPLPQDEPEAVIAVPRERPWASAKRLMEKTLPALQWVVPGIIPEGLTILAGRPKQGKSWGVYGLGIAVATGGKAFGVRPVQGGDVLYLALEDGERRLQERMGILLQGGAIPERFDYAIKWPRMAGPGHIPTPENPDFLSDLNWWLDEHPEVRLVVVDTLARVKPRSQKTGNAYEQDYAAMEPLQKIASERRFGLIVVTHTRKPLSGRTADDIFDEIMDSTGITGGADTMLVLKKTRKEQQVSLWVTGRDVEDEEWLIQWDRDTSDWLLLGRAEEQRTTAMRTAILDCMKSIGAMVSYKEIAERLEKSSPQEVAVVKTTLYRLAECGLVRALLPGKYILIPKEERRLDE